MVNKTLKLLRLGGIFFCSSVIGSAIGISDLPKEMRMFLALLFVLVQVCAYLEGFSEGQKSRANGNKTVNN